MDKENLTESIRTEVLIFLDSHDHFWLHDLVKHLGYTDYDSREYEAVCRICRQLHKDDVLVAANRKGNHIMYLKNL